jgi:tRNA(fMet)-specific endonuclease VapC
MYFLDTNTCIYFLNGQSEGIKNKILSTPPIEIKIPVIVKAELLLGVYKSAKRENNTQKLEAFLQPFEVVAFSDQMSYMYADIRSKTEKAGKPVGPNDLLIAAIVIFNQGVLITNNIAEFENIGGLILENWL